MRIALGKLLPTSRKTMLLPPGRDSAISCIWGTVSRARMLQVWAEINNVPVSFQVQTLLNLDC